MIRGYQAVILIAVVILVALAAEFGEDARPASAIHSSASAVGIDAVITGNLPNSLGPEINACVNATAGTPFPVDVYVRDVTDLVGFYLRLSFNGTDLRVVGNDVFMMLSQGAGSNVVDQSPLPPDLLDGDGVFEIQALDFGSLLTAEDGSGVLTRLTIHPLQVGTSFLSIAFAGQSPSLSSTDGPVQPADAFAVYTGPVTVAEVRVNGAACPVDTDLDGVSDDIDNCPLVPNGPLGGPNNQLDFDNDGLGDVCDPDDDNDGFTDADELLLGSDPFNAASTPEHFSIPLVCSDLLDNDLDGLIDAADPACANSQADSDGDGWTNGDEVTIGTDAFSACGINAWPPDITNDQTVSGGDAAAIFPNWLMKDTDPSWNPRLDLNVDGRISGGDIVSIFPYWLVSC